MVFYLKLVSCIQLYNVSLCWIYLVLFFYLIYLPCLVLYRWVVSDFIVFLYNLSASSLWSRDHEKHRCLWRLNVSLLQPADCIGTTGFSIFFTGISTRSFNWRYLHAQVAWEHPRRLTFIQSAHNVCHSLP